MSDSESDFAYVAWEWEDETQFHCPTCKGTGLTNPLTDQNAVLCLSTMDCPHCDGTRPTMRFVEDDGKDKAAQALGRKGGAARAAKLTPEQRSEIARKAAAKRWK